MSSITDRNISVIDDIFEVLIGLTEPLEFLYAEGQKLDSYREKNEKAKVNFTKQHQLITDC
jgi:hypothetical protein